jgi:capsid protein
MARRKRNKPSRGIHKPAEVRAKFDLAQTTSDNRKHWASADGLSSRAALSAAVRKVVRVRSRYEAENNSWYAGILRTAVNHIVGGAGPRLQLMTGSPEVNRRIEQAWNRWCRITDFHDTLRMAVESYWRDGEVFLMKADSIRRTPVSLDVRLIESDQVASPWDSVSIGDPFSDDGIRFNRNTDEIEIYVYDHHPGSNHYGVNTMSGDWYRARHEVAHLFRAERPGQVRGIPRATPALQTLPIMRRQELATLYSAETAANFAMYLKATGPAVDPAASPADFAEIELTRNMLTTLPEGWEIGQVEPKQPGPLYEMFQRQALMSFSRCTNMPYALAAGTGKDSNFSSFKGDMKNVWQPEVQVEQSRIDNTILQPVLQWFFESAIYAPGLLDGAPPIDQIDFRWHWPPLPELDAVESAQAAMLRMASGLSGPSEEYSRRGAEWATESERAAADFGVTVEEYRRSIFSKVFETTAAASPAESVVTTNTTAVADTAMNGAQVTSIVEIISQVSQKLIPVRTAKALISAAFPAINPANIDQMLAPFAQLPEPSVTASPDAPQGEYTELGQRAFSNNMKRIQQTLTQVASGEMTPSMARITLESIGLSAQRIEKLLAEVDEQIVEDAVDDAVEVDR